MKKLIAGVIIFGAGFAFASEFSWHRSVAGPYIIDTVSGHGKTCYVLVDKNPNAQPVLLWCE